MTTTVLSILQQGMSMLMEVLGIVMLGLLWFLRDHLLQYLDSRTNVHERQLLSQLGREAFVYAETVYKALDGPAKLNEATKYMIDVLQARGKTDIAMKDIRALIENAWLEDRRASGKAVFPQAVPHEIR